MRELSPSDLFEVRRMSLFSSLDETVLFDFYLPILGGKALSFFLALTHLGLDESYSHEAFLKNCQGSVGEFSAALSGLEAIGLIRSYVKPSASFHYYVYCLYAPRSPKDFLGNELLVGTLKKYLDNDKIGALQQKYQTSALPDGDYSEVSETFRGFFAPDLNDPAYRNAGLTTGGRTSGPLQTGFDRNVFLKALLGKDPRMSTESFSAEEMVKIARLATLYSYNEEAMADFAYEAFSFARPQGSRLNLSLLEKACQENLRFAYLHQASAKKSEVHDDSALARTIRKMDSFTPVQFLSYLQKGNKPAQSDLELLQRLTVEMGLSSGVCNALIFYVVTRKEGQLPSKYVEKIAAALVREGIETALDAMNYFTHGSEKSVAPSPTSPAVEKTPETPELTAANDKVSEEEFDALMSNLYNPKKGAS